MALPALTTVTTLAELEDMAGGWDELVRSMPRPSPFLLHGWIVEWWRHFGEGHDLRVHVAMRGDSLVAALPLFVRRERGLRVAELLGSDQAFLADVLVAEGEGDDVVAALGRHAASGDHDWTHLHSVAGASRLASAVGPELLRSIERVSAPVLDMSAGWAAVYQAKTNARKRTRHRRRRSQIEELGNVAVRIARTQEEMEDVLDDTFRLHEARWRGRHDGSGYATPAGRRFQRAAVARLAPLGVPRIVTLELEGQPIAFHYYLALAGRMYVYRLAFDPEYAARSPGFFNTLDALAAASDEGLTYVEWMGDAEWYKNTFADRNDPAHEAFGLAPTARGRVAAAAAGDALRLRLRLRRLETLRRAHRRLRALGRR